MCAGSRRAASTRIPNITVTKSAPATALVDGDNGMGHLVMTRAANEAIAMARETGVAWVGVRRSNHAGPAGLYAEMPTAHGMIGLYAAVANANHMATWGGTDLLLGTNPLAIGVPSGAGPLVLDMATSIVAYGTVKKYALRGLTMPEGWFVKPDTGESITDPNRSGEGILLPMGEYKGAGLALMLGLLGGVLNGAAFGRDVVDFNADDTSETNTGHFMVAIDIARFVPLATFTAEVDRHVNDFRQSKRLPGVDEIRLPGDRRAQCSRGTAARRRADRAGAFGAARQARGGAENKIAARAIEHDAPSRHFRADIIAVIPDRARPADHGHVPAVAAGDRAGARRIDGPGATDHFELSDRLSPPGRSSMGRCPIASGGGR